MSNQEVLYFSAYKVHEHLNCTQVFMDIYPSFHGHILKKKMKALFLGFLQPSPLLVISQHPIHCYLYITVVLRIFHYFNCF